VECSDKHTKEAARFFNGATPTISHNTCMTPWRRGGKEPTSDLVFTNDVRTFTPDTSLNLAELGSDHYMSAAYQTPVWHLWCQYAENEPSFDPVYYEEAYKHLLQVVAAHSMTITAVARSKKWWDEDLSIKLYRMRHDT